MKKTTMILLVCAVFSMLCMGVGYAVDKQDAVSGASVTRGSAGTLTETTAGNDTAGGGNVTALNLSAGSVSTIKWQAYYGEVSGSISIGLNSDVLFSFGNVPQSQIKTVFASTGNDFDFSALEAGTGANVDSQFTFNTADIDSGANTFNTTEEGTATIATVTSVPVVNLTGYGKDSGSNCNDSAANNYRSGVFRDTGSPAGKGDLAFGVSVDADKCAFDNATNVDYELIVPVSLSATNSSGTETYFFFLDIE